MMKQALFGAIHDLKNYGLKMGAHCQAQHGGLVALNVDCDECMRLYESSGDIWKRIYAEVSAEA